MTNKIEITKSKLERLLVCSVRYALGRSTYIVSDIVDDVLFHWDDLTDNCKKAIINSIECDIAMDNYGMEMDLKEWQKVLEKIGQENPDIDVIAMAKEMENNNDK